MSELPHGWAKTNFDDLADINPGRLVDVAAETHISFVPMPAVSDTEGEIVSPSVRPFAEVSKGYTQFRDGDVIFAKITPCMENGKIAVARGLENGVACGSTEFHVVRPLGGISPDFIWRYLRQKSFRNDAEASMTGAVGQRRVPASFLKEQPFALPPLPEQRRIVTKIDSLTGKSKRARDHINHIPRLVQKYKQAVLAAALRGDLTREWRAEHNQLKAWKKTTPSAHFDWSSGKNLPSKKQIPGNVPVIGGNGIGGYHNEALIDFSTLVIGRVGAQCGNVHFSAGPAWITDNAIYARSISDEIDLAFAVIFFRDADLNRLAGGSGQPYVNQTTLNVLSLALPTVVEQREIVRRVEMMLSWIDRLAADATSARKLIDHLDQSILAKAFRGELVPQDPSDEPASVLLDRIRTERAAVPKPKRGHRKVA